MTSPQQVVNDPEATTVVCVIGGLTMAEISCLRRIKFSNNLTILVSSVVTGTRMLKSVSSL